MNFLKSTAVVAVVAAGLEIASMFTGPRGGIDADDTVKGTAPALVDVRLAQATPAINTKTCTRTTTVTVNEAITARVEECSTSHAP